MTFSRVLAKHQVLYRVDEVVCGITRFILSTGPLHRMLHYFVSAVESPSPDELEAQHMSTPRGSVKAKVTTI
jgi:hypothetical protein